MKATDAQVEEILKAVKDFGVKKQGHVNDKEFKNIASNIIK